MGAWSDLPNELATMILHSLKPLDRARNSRNHIIHCTYVSHQFRNIIEPILYREVTISIAYEDDDDAFRQLSRLIRTVISRPQLGKYIQVLNIPSLPEPTFEPEGINSSLTLEDVENIFGTETSEFRPDFGILLDAAARLGLPNGLIHLGGLAGQLCLLLHHLPRLQKLKMKMGSDSRLIAFAALGGITGGVPVGLQSVFELWITYDEEEELGRLSTETIVPFMTLPSLTSFTVFQYIGKEGYHGLQIGLDSFVSSDADKTMGIEPRSMDLERENNHRGRSVAIKTSSGYTLPPRLSSVTHLNLLMSGAPDALLSRILTLPAALESFQYQIEGELFNRFTPSRILPGLLTQANSLKKLVIDTSYSERHVAPIGSLADLRVLEQLKVPADMLLTDSHANPDVPTENPLDTLLPPSLISLELHLHAPWWTDPTRLLIVTGIPKTLPTTAQRLPALRHIGMIRIGSSVFQNEEAVLAEASRICPQITLELKEK